MPRQPKLRKKKVGRSVYWFTRAGGDTYFGNAAEVSHQQARKLFADHLVRIQAREVANKGQALTAGELMDLFLDWVQKHRDRQSYATRKNYCSRFGAFRVGSSKARVADLPADRVRGERSNRPVGRVASGIACASTPVPRSVSRTTAPSSSAPTLPTQVALCPRRARPMATVDSAPAQDSLSCALCRSGPAAVA